jgi:putative ABC transport system permease protein
LSELAVALAYLRARALGAGVEILLLATGIATIVVVLLVGGQLRAGLLAEVRGIDLVVGAKGSPLQLVLSAVLHADVPTGNIPQAEADAIAAHPQVAWAIPLALGDGVGGFRLVGTSDAFRERAGATVARGRPVMADFEAVLGATAARRLGLAPGDRFVGTHGLVGVGPRHDQHPFTVVGVLTPTGRIVDRLVLTTVGSVRTMHAAQRPPGAPEEVTALLVGYRSPLAALQLPRLVSARGPLQAAVPAVEAARLASLLGTGADILRSGGLALCVAAALGLLAALVQSLETRAYDLALMRVMGGTPGRLARIVLLEALALAAAGLAVGLVLGHAAVEVIGRVVPAAADAGVTGLALDPRELWLGTGVLALAALAALWPAWRAARTDLAAVLARRG